MDIMPHIDIYYSITIPAWFIPRNHLNVLFVKEMFTCWSVKKE
jgi:hypothetical protein